MPSANRLRPASPPARADTFQTLARPAEPLQEARQDRPHRAVQRAGQGRVQGPHRGARRRTRARHSAPSWKSCSPFTRAAPARRAQGVPLGEARAGRIRPFDFWATEDVFNAIGKIAAERRLSVSGLIEDLLAREVARLDPHGGKFGVDVRAGRRLSPPLSRVPAMTERKNGTQRVYPPDYVSAETLAYRLDCSPSTIEAYVRAGLLPKPERIGNLPRWDFAAVVAFIKARNGARAPRRARTGDGRPLSEGHSPWHDRVNRGFPCRRTSTPCAPAARTTTISSRSEAPRAPASPSASRAPPPTPTAPPTKNGGTPTASSQGPSRTKRPPAPSRC